MNFLTLSLQHHLVGCWECSWARPEITRGVRRGKGEPYLWGVTISEKVKFPSQSEFVVLGNTNSLLIVNANFCLWFFFFATFFFDFVSLDWRNSFRHEHNKGSTELEVETVTWWVTFHALGLIDQKGTFFLARIIDSDYQVELERESWSEETIYMERAGLWYIG